MSATIDLSISGISVSLRLFDSQDYPRISVDGQAGAVSYTATGVAVGNGRIHEPKFLWSITAYCDDTQQEALDLIWVEHDRLRRTFQTCDILIYDKTRLYREPAPRSRAIAPGTSEIPYPRSGTATHVSYFACFCAWMSDRPRYSIRGSHVLATIGLSETVRVVPA